MEIEDIARIAHEVNRAYCDSMGDHSQPRWEDAPAWQKKSSIDGVSKVLQNNLSPEDSHNSWAEHKINNGWVYGPEKNTEKKEHPCLVPYSSLSQEQQTKDHLFVAVVNSLRPYLNN